MIKAVLKDNFINVHEDRYLLTSLTRACSLRNDRVKSRLPICKDLVHVILDNIQDRFMKLNQPYLSILYTTMVVTAYYGLFRIGELATGSHPMLVDDVHVGTNKKKFLFVLRSSKTHTRGMKPQKIKISMTKHKAASQDRARKTRAKRWCPYKMLKIYSSLRVKSKSRNESFFIFKDRSPVKPSQLREVLKTTLKKGKFDPSLYGFHSLRTGRSIDLLKLGFSVETIKQLGRWKSNVAFNYLK